MRVLYDIDIPIISEYLSSHNFESQSFVGRELTNDFLRIYKPDVLFIRSTTKIDETLLNGVPISFIGTATSGTDHIDENYTTKKHIQTVSAKGSNANAVAEYVISCLLELSTDKNFDISDKTIGIVGYGNVGQRLAAYAERLGLRVLVNDPPSKENNDTFHHHYSDLAELLSESDIVTFHVPFTNQGVFATEHLLNDERIPLLKKNAIIINASRGSVIDEQQLLQSHTAKNFTFIIDTWSNEPKVSLPFLKQSYISTPHIAGYTINSKKNAAYVILSQWLRHFNILDENMPKIRYDISNSDARWVLSEHSEYLLRNKDKLLHDLRAARGIVQQSEKFHNNFPSEQNRMVEFFDIMRKRSADKEETLSLMIK